VSKRKKIEDAKRAFLGHEGTFLEKCKLAEKFLTTIKSYGNMDSITRSKEWKENRAKKLKDCCETCGSTDGLHISHTWHPPRGKAMVEHVKRVHSDKLGSIPYGEQKNSCPVCSSTSVNFLKTQQKWKCYAKKIKFKPHVLQRIRVWETIKDEEGVRDRYYKHYNVDTDEKIVGSIQGLIYYTQERQVYADMDVRDFWEKFKTGGTLEVVETVVEQHWRRSRKYWQNRHKVSCGAIFAQPKTKMVDKKITSNMVWNYYYALENISLTDRYIEMRSDDILTECKECGFKRDQVHINRKKIKDSKSHNTLEFLRNKYKTS